MTTNLFGAVHRARRDLADDLSTLSDDAWRSPTLCTGWNVEQVVAHLTAAASLGRGAWLRSIVLAGFRPAVHNERRLREHLGPTPAETLARFRAVVSSTIVPSNDLPAYLGEVVVHGEDIRRPLDLPARVEIDAATAVADYYASRNFTVNSLDVAAGLELRANDGPFHAGSGPEVTGPTLALLMTLAGRRSHLHQLTGPGVTSLARRVD